MTIDKTKFWNRFLSFKGGLPVEEPYPQFYITAGVIYLRDHGNGGWLIDAIYNNLPKRRVADRDIVLCDLTVQEGVGTLVMDDHIISDRQRTELRFTNIEIPIDYVPLYCQPVESDWVLMTPHESMTMRPQYIADK